jgi:hypothetical protein
MYQEAVMRNPIFTGMFLIASLLGASSCAGELDEVDKQSSEAMIGVDDGSFADEAIPIDDTNTVLLSPQQCTPGNICIWDPAFFAGLPMFKTAQAGCINLPPAANNKSSSWWNRTTFIYRLYAGRSCALTREIAPPGLANPSMTSLNDLVKSICRGSTCP